jgi:radical SAM protein with 4Fe4S-binding SPASM domain
MRPTPALSNPLNRWDDHPFIVIWEVTRSCALACRHCRAEAQHHRDPHELSTEEGKQLIDQVARATPGYFILTGGDPMMRPDLLELIAYARAKGLEVALSPSATPKFLKADLNALHKAGLHRLSLSIDGASRETHDTFRGVKGTWDWTQQAMDACRRHGLSFQINTTLTRQNLEQFDQFVELMNIIRPAMWNLFLLVPTGRGKSDDLLGAEELEALFHRIYALSKTVPYKIKTTEGQHYRRVAWQHWREENSGPPPMLGNTNDGKGFIFVSHTGDICPSGFLPLAAGNVRGEELIEVYRNSPMLQSLRDPAQLKGKCGRCEWNRLCGGSRARAYAMTGDYLAAEPLCVYQPHSSPQPPPTTVAHPGKIIEG